MLMNTRRSISGLRPSAFGTRHSVRAFTLVEVLSVVAIILLLVAVLLPGIAVVRNSAKKNRARTEVASLFNALKAYYNEYTKWPTNLAGYDSGPDIEGTTTGIQVYETAVRMLAGQDEAGQNPRRVMLMEVAPGAVRADGAFMDPWGNPYKYMCDFNYDGTLHVLFTGLSGSTDLVDTAVAVWSRGKDHSDKPGFQADDIRSWK